MNIRNIAIIAHVDHGKTTLVDGMLHGAGIFRSNQHVEECVLDSNDLERERGITILSKNISVMFDETKINIIDTPGHSDFGGEVERVLKMANGVLLLVDAFEGPMPQTRFVLRKALDLDLRPVVIINKIDRPDCRPIEVLDEVFDLFCSLDASNEQLDFPVLYASGRDRYARRDPDDTNTDFLPLFETIISEIPPPAVQVDGPFQMLVTSLQHSEFTGRMAVGRVFSGSVMRGDNLCMVSRDGEMRSAQAKKVSVFEGLGRQDVEVAEAGDIIAIEGLEGVEISDTLCDPEHVEAIGSPPIDEPTLSMMFAVNNSPFAGQEGKFVTSRQIRDRLHRELNQDVALRVEDTDRPEILKVSGRGLLHLGILIENMRREGFEFSVGKPRVIMREIDGKKHEPLETLVVDVPDVNAGKVIEVVGRRRGELTQMSSRIGLTNIEFTIPARGLIGLRTRLLTLTQGEATMSHLYLEHALFKGDIPSRSTGVLISSENGQTSAYSLFNLKDRGAFFVGATARVYKGMIVGEHSKDNDLEVNVCREKKLTNMRSSGADKKLIVAPPRLMSLEECLEFIEDDELVEVTPTSIRLRKIDLLAKHRKRSTGAGV